MSAAYGAALAVIFVWLGMVVAISFIETPLRFRAPGVSLQVGLGIGRLVFRALNTVEAVLAVVLLIAIGVHPPALTPAIAIGVAVVALVCQLLVVRPVLNRRSDAVLATAHPPAESGASGASVASVASGAPGASVASVASGASGGSSRRSRAHYGYVALEVAKIAALVVGGVAMLSI